MSEVLAESQRSLRDIAGELEKVAVGEGAGGSPLKAIAASLRQIADDGSAFTGLLRFTRGIAAAARQVAEWRERRFGISTPLQKPDRGRDRLDAIAGKLAAAHDAVAAVLAPPDLRARPEAITFGDAHRAGGAVTVVVPVGAGDVSAFAVLAALSRAQNQTSVRILVVADGGADEATNARLRDEAAAGRIELIEDAMARGFAASANAGLRLAQGDAVLLDGATLVADHWLDRLWEAAASAADIAAVVPLSNASPVAAYPYAGFDNPLPPDASLTSLVAAASANESPIVPIPAAGGGCIYMKAPAIAAIGLLDAAAFPNGIAAAADWSLRAGAKGWRTVAAPRVFVFHDIAGSLAPAAQSRTARAMKTLIARHPRYQGLAEQYRRSDPLAPARRVLDGERLRAGLVGREHIIVHLVHGWGGGVEVHAVDLATRQTQAGAGALVLKIAGPSTVRVVVPDDFPSLTFDLAKPGDVESFRHIAAPANATLHLHHVVGLDLAHVDTLRSCFANNVLTLHDFYFITPQITLRDWTGQPCPVRPTDECDHCVDVLKPPAPFIRPVAAHRAAMARIAGGARRVFTPSVAARDLLRRGMPDVVVTVAPHIDEGPIAPPRPPARGARIVATIGAFNADKGAPILADVITDAGARKLPLRFVIAGQAVWKDPPPNVSVLGPYDRHSIAGILERTAGHIAFLPSVVPETYMFSLSECVRAGYFPVVFDLGAQAERVRQLGWGKILPMGMSAAEINDVLAGVEIPALDRKRIEAWLTVDRLQPMGYYSSWWQSGRGTAST